jgi:aminoglycoside phosphotransferase (APT) family kinase protein
MSLHEGELPIDESVVVSLLREQRPEWAAMPLAPAGAGTDNVMFRLGDELLVRMPRTADKATSLRKEREWMPRLAPRLPFRIPEPVHAGAPGPAYPLEWSVYRWIEGREPSESSVRNWSGFGADLAMFVRSLHRADLMGAVRAGDLSWYRGGSLRACDAWVSASFDEARALVGGALDVDTLERWWREAIALPEPSGPHVWLHGDLRPGNLLVHDGRLHAVIDFGGLSVGAADAEHATIWDLPARARRAYWDELDIDDVTWARARAWAIAVAAGGISYYWHTYPEFVAECRARLDAILAADERP